MYLAKWKMYVGFSFLGLILLTMSTFNWMLLFWSFFGGVAIPLFILRPGYKIPNLLPSKLEPLHSITIKKNEIKLCGVCGEKNCSRERSENALEVLQPWIGIEVNEKVDKAVSEFLELLLEKYVWKWYRNLSEDEMFIHELKIALRHCLATLYRRVNKVDLAEIIIKKLIRLAVLHLNVCLLAKQAGCNSEDEILMWYGSKIHQALKSRRDELNYLRALCDCLFPHLFPPQLVKSKIGKSFLREVLASNVILYGIDTIDDPDKINRLLLIFFDESPPREADGPPSPMVPFLEEFTSHDFKSSDSLLYIDLPKIIATQEMLYPFMTFLKTVGAVHHLQFCLTVQDFNERCLAQGQDTDQQVKLHSEAREIYKSYCCVDSPTFIHFSEDIIHELRDIANGECSGFSRLRTSAPLFRAYDHVYNLLENVFCPMFYQSDIKRNPYLLILLDEAVGVLSLDEIWYYKMVCGNRRSPKQKKATASSKQAAVPSLDRDDARRSSLKKKDAKSMDNSSIVDESDLDQDTNFMEEDEKSSQLLMEDEAEEDSMISRDLSTWRLEVPSIKVMKKDEEMGRNPSMATERFYVFSIEVKRVDMQEDDDMPEQWVVLRRYPEFYVLENKLTQFHGNLHFASLPPKKHFARSFAFLDSKRAEFERFLKTLISQPGLQHSELLFDFLYPERAGATSGFDTKLLPDVKLGRLFRRVPNKLVKEKGQHLSNFLQSFIQSCESPKPKPGKYEPITDNPEIQMDHKLHNELYPESDWQFDAFQSATEDGKAETIRFFTGVCDYLIFIAVRVFNADIWIHYVMVGLKIIFKNTIEPYAHSFLTAKMNIYRQEHHVVDLIHLFRDILFYDDHPPRTMEEKQERRELAYQAWMDYLPDSFVSIIGESKHKSGCKEMFEILQQPKLNKQLGYLLLDTFLLELFPELNTPSSDQTS